MKQTIAKVVAIVVSASLVGCSNMGQDETVGVGAGAVAGGLLGSLVGGGTGKAVAVGVGIVAGALVGGAIGKSMDEADQAKMSQSLDSNSPTYWTNNKTGAKYEVVPGKWVTVNGNSNCRNYYTIGYVNGKKEKIYGTACRNANGTWQNVSTK
ncbi:MAG TPA: RT0821/Lpp0805 family surface protein [Gammaproteobacteria bacterium]|jgi:surface antigen|nr:RT0821/Lpp0805 family surface protein [Gammaproteobacteria bacterium]